MYFSNSSPNYTKLHVFIIITRVRSSISMKYSRKTPFVKRYVSSVYIADNGPHFATPHCRHCKSVVVFSALTQWSMHMQTYTNTHTHTQNKCKSVSPCTRHKLNNNHKKVNDVDDDVGRRCQRHRRLITLPHRLDVNHPAPPTSPSSQPSPPSSSSTSAALPARCAHNNMRSSGLLARTLCIPTVLYEYVGHSIQRWFIRIDILESVLFCLRILHSHTNSYSL